MSAKYGMDFNDYNKEGTWVELVVNARLMNLRSELGFGGYLILSKKFPRSITCQSYFFVQAVVCYVLNNGNYSVMCRNNRENKYIAQPLGPTT